MSEPTVSVPPVFLLGGGWTPEASEQLYGPFLDAAGAAPTVACVVVDEGDGPAQFERWASVLRTTRTCEPVPLLVPLGSVLDVSSLGSADGLLVCGGLTPAYADTLAPVAAELREWLREGRRPYAGFSAGCAVAAERAVVGGWLLAGRPVCPADAGEDLDEVTVVPGLGLVPFATDVHAAQWGTLGRLVAAVSTGAAPAGVAVDEDTVLSWDGGRAAVSGTGGAWLVTREADGARVRLLAAGTGFTAEDL